jgi:hypothetical protein
MDDVPTLNVDECSAELQAVLLASAPQCVSDTYALCPEWLSNQSYSFSSWHYNQRVCLNYKWSSYGTDNFPPEAKALVKKWEATQENRKQFVKNFEATVAGVSSTEKLEKMFPELVQYMPAKVTKTENLPVCANLMADIVKLGWPDGKKNASPN